jgi:hypothetical protein
VSLSRVPAELDRHALEIARSLASIDRSRLADKRFVEILHEAIVNAMVTARDSAATTPARDPSAPSFVILGEPASKANSREIGVLKFKDKATGEVTTRAQLRKSDKALDYEADALKQIPPRFRQQLEGPVRVTLKIFYASERPDLDESIVLDVLQNRYQSFGKGEARKRELVQKGVYLNDRQVREKHVFHGIDRANPRTEVLVEPLQAQQIGFDLVVPRADPLEV